MWRAAVLILCFSFSAAMAESVVLVSKDGFTKIEGDLVSFDTEFYVLATTIGEVKIPVSDVSCSGDGCPIPGSRSVDKSLEDLSPGQQQKLFKDFVEWIEKNEDSTAEYEDLFQRFVDWQKQNAN